MWIFGQAYNSVTADEEMVMWHYDPVPEPGTAVLLAAGLAVWWRRGLRGVTKL